MTKKTVVVKFEFEGRIAGAIGCTDFIVAERTVTVDNVNDAKAAAILALYSRQGDSPAYEHIYLLSSKVFEVA